MLKKVTANIKNDLAQYHVDINISLNAAMHFGVASKIKSHEFAPFTGLIFLIIEPV